MKILIIISLVFVVHGKTVFYDSYRGTVLTEEELKKHNKDNTTFWCVNEIEPCDPEEGRRVDGSCNNLAHPVRGAAHTPFYRVLPPVYDKDFEPKKAKSGQELPLTRYLRTNLLPEGRVLGQQFTMLVTYYMVFMASDFAAPHDTINYIHWKPHCCTPKGKSDHMCTPVKVPDDDPVLRFSDVRCLNLTRPISFQSSGCVPNDTSPERLDSATPMLDLSTVYGREEKALRQKGRLFKDGLLKVEEENGRIWPPSYKSHSLCYGNEPPLETRCHAGPDDAMNGILGLNLPSIWFWRLHNLLAKELGEINPCWDDEKLFRTAKDLNIALAAQIYYYEVLALLMGKENLENDEVLSRSPGHRDVYNKNVIPQVSLEYPFVLRWMHLLQEGMLKFYDTNGIYVKSFPITNFTLRTGLLPLDNTIDYVTQGSFRQGTAKNDYVVDPEVAERGFGNFQRVLDIPTNDLTKNRYFGFQPYVIYREHCFGRTYRTFEDLSDAIEPERLERLKDTYEDVTDIDLLSGIWLENRVEGGYVPETFYCLMVEQLRRNIRSDRHWYERPNRPHAFTEAQLKQVRKFSIAMMLCLVGDKVSHIQQEAFLRAGPENLIGSCKELDEIDFWAWEDGTCQDTR